MKTGEYASVRREKLLIVDDEALFCDILKTLFEEEYDVAAFSLPEDAVRHIRENDIDVVLTDLYMPRIDGMKILDLVKAESPLTDVIIMTAYAKVESAIEAMKKGAYDYIIKPFSTEELSLVLKKLCEKRKISAENLALRQFIDVTYRPENIIGESTAMKKVYRLIAEVSRMEWPVLITGESGTGKELVARAVHFSGKRGSNRLISVDCASFTRAEMYGRETAAHEDQPAPGKGFFEEAQGGTVVFDEIGDMGLTLQDELVDVLKKGSLRRIGGTRDVPIDTRIIATTNKNLNSLRETGRFSQDLFYLNTFNLNIPPLRERREDIPLLVEHFFSVYRNEFGKSWMKLSREAMEVLKEYGWPGNVRELKNLFAAICLLEDDRIISPEHIHRRLGSSFTKQTG